MSFWETLLWVGLGVIAGLAVVLPVIIFLWLDLKEQERRNGGDTS